MTVKELIEELKKAPPDMEVLQAADEEGNRFNKTAVVEWSDRDSEGVPCHPDGADPEQAKCIVLWP